MAQSRIIHADGSDERQEKHRCRWEDRYNNGDWHCSNCGAVVEKDEQINHNWYFCYHCGKRMEGTKDVRITNRKIAESMNWKEEWEKMYETAQRAFKDHRATLIQDSDRFTIIDWRKANGEGDYYCNFIVDKKRGSLIVSGDLGDSIATWFSPVTVSKLKRYIFHDISYYMSKFQCTSDDYCYDEKYVFECLMEHLFGYGEDFEENLESYVSTSEFYSIEEFKEEMMEEVNKSIHDDDFIPTERLCEIATDVYPDAWEGMHRLGAQIKTRVYLWAIGFNMACDQIGM